MDKTGPWAQRRALIADLLQECKPQCVLLQAVKKLPELHAGEDQAHQLARLSGFPFVYASASSSTDFMAILSRMKLRGLDVLRLNLSAANTEDLSPRILQKAEFEHQHICIFNAYFSWVEAQAQRNMAESLPFLNAFDGPALLAGDFNAPAPSGLFASLEGSGWVDVWKHVHQREAGYTYPAGHPKDRIDYAFANSRLIKNIKDIQVVGDRPANGIFASDHFGLLIELD